MEDKFKLNKTSLMQKIQLLRIAIANLSVYTVSRQLAQYSAVIKFAFYYFTHAFLISKKKISVYVLGKNRAFLLVHYHFSLDKLPEECLD